MTELMHGGDRYGCGEEVLDFSSNISPLGLPEKVKEALAADIAHWDCYPDPLCRDLTAAIAAYEQVPADWILCGNGSADLIFRIARGIKGKHAMVTAPAFAEYEQALSSCGYEVMHHTLHEKDRFALTAGILNKITPALDVLILCNPHNPTGQVIEPGLLHSICERCRQCETMLVVDECFLPFLEDAASQSLKQKLGENPYIILLHAFTKTYAMAGLRLGYLLCSSSKVLAAVTTCAQPWSVSTPAQTAGIAALSDPDYLQRVKALVTEERAYLVQALERLKLTVYDSRANFVFFKCHNRRDLTQQLRTKGILIRSCSNYYGLDSRFYRVAVRTHPENVRLIEALAQELGDR